MWIDSLINHTNHHDLIDMKAVRLTSANESGLFMATNPNC